MKKIFFLSALLYATMTVKGQMVQNAGFENWQVNNYYEYPEGWFILNEGNPNTFAEKVSGDAQLGNYSIKLNSVTDGVDVMFGLTIYGSIGDNGDGFKGLPFDKTGNMFHYWYKSNMQSGDMGMVMLILWQNGVKIDSVVYPVMASQASWTHAMFPVNAGLVQPDSMFLAFLSSIPADFGGSPVNGTWLQVDNIYFTNGANPTPLTVPNFSFEDWVQASAEDPTSWSTTNAEFNLQINDTTNVNKTSDASSGNYAVVMTNVGLNGDVFNAEIEYRQPFNKQPDKFYFDYKYFPSGTDTLNVNIKFYKYGNSIGGGWFQHTQEQSGYTLVEMDLWYNEIPDEIEIRFMPGNNAGSVLYIDDISFSCTKPVALYGEFSTPGSIDVSWNAGGDETQWLLEWGLSGFAQGTGTLLSVNSTPQYIINGVNDANSYDVYVAALCGIGDTSAYSGPFVVCDGTQVPVNEGFEGLQNGQMPACWNSYATGNAQVWADDWNAMSHSGQKFLKMNFGNPNKVFAVSPRIEDPLNTLYMSFYARKNTGTNQAQILLGTMSNPLDITTFTILQTYDLTNSYINFEYYFDTYSGTDKFIAMRLISNDGGAEAFVDDVLIDLIPACIQPQNLTVNIITSNSAHVQWNAGGQTLWNIVYGEMGFNPQTEGNSEFGLTSAYYDLSGLNSGTAYDVYVQTNCGANGNSSWAKYTFMTICTPINTPINEDFEGSYLNDLPNCWSSLIQGEGMAYVTPWGGYNSQSAVNMKVNDNLDSLLLITPELVQDISLLYLTFYARENTSNNAIIILGTLADPNDISSFTPLQQFALTSSYQMFNYNFNAYSGNDHYVAFLFKTPVNQYTEALLDKINLQYIPTCFPPENMALQNVTATTGTINWQPGDSETLWNLIYVNSGQDPFTNGTLVSGINDTLYLIPNLMPGSMYDVILQSDCGSGDTSVWTMPFTFGTGCNTYTAPYVNNFDNETIWQIPQCWKRLFSHTDGAAYCGLQNLNAFSQANHIYLNNATTQDLNAALMMVTPRLQSVSDKEISFYARASQNGTPLLIGYKTDQNNPADFTLITTLNLTTSYTKYIVPLNAQTGDLYIAFSHGQAGEGNNKGVFIDNFSYDVAVACHQPASLNASGVNDHEALLTWQPGYQETIWHVEVGNPGFTPGTQNYLFSSYGHATTSWMISTLNPGTAYAFYVRADCGAGDSSSWVGPVNFTTLCAVFSTPFIQDFELGTFPPPCWQRITGSGDWERASSISAYGTGAGSARAPFYNIENHVPFDLISCDINTSNLTDPQLSFDYAYANYDADNFDSLKLYFSMDGGATYFLLYTMSGLGELNTAGTSSNFFTPTPSQWRNKSISLPAGTNKLKFRAISGWGNNLYLDNIKVDNPPTCPKPVSLSASVITASSADLSWLAGGTENIWNVEVGAPGFVPATSTWLFHVVGTTSNPWQVNGLSDNTVYEFYVQADCGSGDLSAWAGPFQFKTPCLPFSMPFSEDFTGINQGSIPDCWSVTSGNWQVSSSALAGGAIPELNFTWNPHNTGQVIVKTPLIDATTYTSLMLSFRHRLIDNPTGNNYKLIVKVTSDDINWSTVWLNTPTSDIPAQIVEQDISAFAGENIRVAWIFEGDSWDIDEWYIDNILVDEMTACPYPDSLDVSNITSSGAQLEWIAGGTETTWNIEIGNPGFIPGATQQQFAYTGITTNPYSANGLNPHTNYEFYVQGDCGSNELSNWAGPFSFSTICPIYQLPYIENFDAPLACWSVYDEDGQTPVWAINSSYNHTSGGNGSIYHLWNNSYGNNQTGWLYSPQIQLPPASDIELSFWSYNLYPDYYASNKVFVSTDGINYTEVWAASSVQELWTKDVINLSSFAGETINIAFRYEGDFAHAWILDDVSIEEVNCLTPDTVSISNVTTTSADINWTAGGTETAWNITVNEWPSNTLFLNTTVNITPSYSLTGLQSNTGYVVYIQADCGGGQLSNQSGPYYINTKCEVFANPFTENFDATTPGQMPDCWSRILDVNYFKWVEVNTNYFYSASRSLLLWNGNNSDPGAQLLAITPELSSINQHQVKFYAKSNMSGGQLVFGTITDPTDALTFTPIQTLTLSTNYQEYYIPLSNYSGTDTYLAFKHATAEAGDNVYLSVDNFIYEMMDACPKPTQLWADNFTSNTADLHWFENGSALQWQVEYGLNGFVQGTGSYVMVSANPEVTLSSLPSNSIYDFYVRAICAPGDTSDWSSVFTFQTICGVYSNPFTENFDATQFEEMPDCWSRIVEHATEAFVGAHNFLSPLSQPYHLFLWNGNVPDPAGVMIAITPEVTNINQHQLRFYAKNNHGGQVEIGTMSDPTDAATFTLFQTLTLTQNYEEYIIQLASYSGADNYIAFRHALPAQGNDEIIAIDNFSYEPLQTCPNPTQLYSQNVSSTSVEVSWVENGSASLWQVEWGLQGFAQGSGNTIIVNDTNALLTGLIPYSDYEFYVRAICGVGDTSTWAGLFAFFTDLLCVDNTVHSQVATPIQYALWSSQDYDKKVHQNFAGVNSVFDGLHFWGRLNNTTGDCYSNPITLEVAFYNDNNGSIGTQLNSFTVPVTPDSLFYDNGQYYEFTVQFPQVIQMTEGWFSVQSVNSPTCYLLIAATSNPNAYGTTLRVENQGADTLPYAPIGYCFLNTSHIVHYIAGQGGSISGQDTQYVVHGGSTTQVTAVPDNCYQFIRWSDVVPDNPRSDTPVVADFSVTAIFAPVVVANFINEEICEGDTFYFGNQALVDAGDYQNTYQSSQGCDSVVYLSLFINPKYEYVEAVQICTGQSYSWHGQSYSAAGTYYDSLQTNYGCDSVYILQLLLNPKYEISNFGEVCQGNAYNWHGNDYTEQGVYYDSLLTSLGCDSVYILNLTVNPSFEIVEDTAICDGETYIWRGTSYNTQGIYYDSLITSHICDSVFVLNLTVNPVYNFTETHEICQGEVYQWHGLSLINQGVYYDSLTTQSGCDSVYALNLTVYPAYEFTQTEHICDGGIFTWRGNDYNTTGWYYDSLQTNMGCDSVYVLHLLIEPLYHITNNITICDGETYPWHGNNYTTQGVYYDSLYSVYGCDSIFTLNLTVKPSYEFTQQAVICNGDVLNWRGNNYSVQGTYFDSLSTVAGCDSIFVLNLTVNQTYLFNHFDTICDGGVYSWRGHTYTTSGVYYDSLVTTLGCDSVYTLNLHVVVIDLTVTHNSTTLSVPSQSAIYQWVDCNSNFALIAGATNNSYTATINGSYAVIIYKWNCADTSICVTVDDVYINNPQDAANVFLYPNPSNGHFTLQISEEALITVYNLLGEIVYNNALEKGLNELQFEHLSCGVYYFHVKSSKFDTHVKVIIQK